MTKPTIPAVIAEMRACAESYESQAEGREADDFEFLMDFSALVREWADHLDAIRATYAALVDQWRLSDAEIAKAQGYLEAWNTYQVCANELAPLAAATD